MRIDRCVCFQKTFAELKRLAESTGADSVAALQAHVAFGKKCGLCRPYVRRMLRTGAVVFDHIITEEQEPLGPSDASQKH